MIFNKSKLFIATIVALAFFLTNSPSKVFAANSCADTIANVSCSQNPVTRVWSCPAGTGSVNCSLPLDFSCGVHTGKANTQATCIIDGTGCRYETDERACSCNFGSCTTTAPETTITDTPADTPRPTDPPTAGCSGVNSCYKDGECGITVGKYYPCPGGVDGCGASSNLGDRNCTEKTNGSRPNCCGAMVQCTPNAREVLPSDQAVAGSNAPMKIIFTNIDQSNIIFNEGAGVKNCSNLQIWGQFHDPGCALGEEFACYWKDCFAGDTPGRYRAFYSNDAQCNLDVKYCINPQPPTGLTNTTQGSQISLKWSSSSGSVRYKLRIDNLQNGWSDNCAAGLTGDVCVDNLTTNSYLFTPSVLANYRWWVIATVDDACDSQLSSISSFITLPTPTPFCDAPNPPAINSPSMGACVLPSTPFTVRDYQSNNLPMCYPYDAWGRILRSNSTIAATSNWGVNQNVITATLKDYTFRSWDTAPNLTTGGYIFRSIVANNFQTQSTPSSQNFNVDANPPSVPVVNCNVSRDQNGKVTVDIPITSVSDTGCANLNVSPYWVQLSKDVNFTSVVPGWFNSWTNSPTVHFETTTTTLKPGDVLYYHARSRDALDNQSAWSNVLNCRVPSDGPSCSNMSFNPSSPRKPNQNITVNWDNFDDSNLQYTNALVDNTLDIGGCTLLGSGKTASCARNWTPTASKNYSVTATVADLDNNKNTCTASFCADNLPPPAPAGGISCSFKETKNNINYYTLSYNWNPVADQACAGLHYFPYWAQISTTSNYATAINYEIASGGIRLPDNGWSGDLDTLADVAEGTPVFAHVISRDRVDNQSAWSANTPFTPTNAFCNGPTIAPPIITPTPTPTPNMLTPIGSCGAYNAARGTIPITFRWSGSASRQLQVYEKSGSTISFWWYNKPVTTSPIVITRIDNARTPYAFPAGRRIYSRFGTSSSSPENSIICTPPVSATPSPTTSAPTATAVPTPTITPTPFIPPRKAWFQSQGGNIMAFKGNISSQVPAGESLNTSLPNIASKGTSYFQQNFSAGTAAERKVNSSTFPELTSYSDLKKRFTVVNTIAGDNNLLPADLNRGAGTLGTTVVYEKSGSSTLGVWNNFSGNAVIFVDGSLTVNGNITVAPGSFLGLVTSGDITVNPAVVTIQGFFFTNGTFQTGTNNPLLDSPLIFSGTFVAGNNFNLQRNLGNALNTITPAESFQYRPDFAFSAPLELRRPFRYWQEQSP